MNAQHITLWAALALAVAVLPAQAQQVPADILNHPGYARFDLLSAQIGEEPNVEVFLKGPLLRLAAEASRFEDPALADMLHKLKAVRVYAYHLEDAPRRAKLEAALVETSSAIAAHLSNDGWEQAARIRDDGERIYFYLKIVEERIEGLVVMAIDDEDEAVFVNIVGEVDPADIGRIGQRFRIGALDEIDY